jgi:hypothetical protein
VVEQALGVRRELDDNIKLREVELGHYSVSF